MSFYLKSSLDRFIVASEFNISVCDTDLKSSLDRFIAVDKTA